MATEYKYLQFPLCLVTVTYKDRSGGIDLMISYGIMHYAKKQKYQINEVARQMIYDWYRNNDRMQSKLRSKIRHAISDELFTEDEDYNGFSWDSFNPVEAIDEVLSLFDNDRQFKELAILNYQLHQAGDFLGITIPSFDSTERSYNEAKSIQEAYEAKFGPDVMPSCKKSLLFEFRDQPQQDIEILRAYIGILSLIGYRNFISTSKPVILSRMIGAKSKAAWDQLSRAENIIDTVSKYSKKYHMDNLLLNLAKRKFIMFLSKKAVSIIYVSKYMEPEALAELVRQSQQRHDIKKRIQEAAERI